MPRIAPTRRGPRLCRRRGRRCAARPVLGVGGLDAAAAPRRPRSRPGYPHGCHSGERIRGSGTFTSPQYRSFARDCDRIWKSAGRRRHLLGGLVAGNSAVNLSSGRTKRTFDVAPLFARVAESTRVREVAERGVDVLAEGSQPDRSDATGGSTQPNAPRVGRDRTRFVFI